jgi:NTP pyrophosphatase (non-canonical NTP hydrolase)
MGEELGGGLTIGELQGRIRRMYGAKDAARGDAGTFLWLAEEVGELATALRSGSDDELAMEMADVLAWLVTLANVRGVDLEAAVAAKDPRRAAERAIPGSRRGPHSGPDEIPAARRA